MRQLRMPLPSSHLYTRGSVDAVEAGLQWGEQVWSGELLEWESRNVVDAPLALRCRPAHLRVFGARAAGRRRLRNKQLGSKGALTAWTHLWPWLQAPVHEQTAQYGTGQEGVRDEEVDVVTGVC